MKILVTGGFGNIGYAVLKEASKRGHNVTVFEKPTKVNINKAKKLKHLYEKVVFGDIRNLKELAPCVNGKELIVHLAAIVPPKSENSLRETHDVNVKGLENVINSIIISKQNIKLIHISSFSVSGYIQEQLMPIKIDNHYNSTDAYSQSKVQCEKMLDVSKTNWCIMRLAMVLSRDSKTSIELLEQLFTIPLDYKIETIVDKDVATAIINGAEMMLLNDDLVHQKLYISGGKEQGHQHIFRELINTLFATYHLKPPADKYFTKEKTYGGWFNSTESQRLLQYQKNSYENYLLSVLGDKKVIGIVAKTIDFFLTMKLEVDYRKKLENIK